MAQNKVRDVNKAKEGSRANNDTLLPPTPTSPTPSQSTSPTQATGQSDLFTPLSTSATLSCATPFFTSNPLDALSPRKRKKMMNTQPSSSNTNPSMALSPETLAMAEYLGKMKETVGVLGKTMGFLESQTEEVAKLAPAVKANGQIEQLKAGLQKQMAKQQEDMENLKKELDSKVKEALEKTIREQVFKVLEDCIQTAVNEKVKLQLEKQIPDKLREQVWFHRKQEAEIKWCLENSEARRFNSTLTPRSKEQLRPLLRPLAIPPPLGTSPDPSASSSATATVKPDSPSSSLKTAVENTPLPTKSPLFPKDMRALFSLSEGDIRKLHEDYNILLPKTPRPSPAQATPNTPPTEKPSPTTGPPPSSAEPTREVLINSFVSHIGVRFVPLSTRPTLRLVIPSNNR